MFSHLWEIKFPHVGNQFPIGGKIIIQLWEIAANQCQSDSMRSLCVLCLAVTIVRCAVPTALRTSGDK